MTVHICQNSQDYTLERVYFTVGKLCANFKKGTERQNRPYHPSAQTCPMAPSSLSTMACKALRNVFQITGHDSLVGQELNLRIMTSIFFLDERE